uniref:NADH-ubiquinone oxidoreductase chain 3 n=1 Tax=Tabachnickia sp. DVL-2014 TaxID=1569960 RepID=A0A0N7AFU2_9METZ|nr:NADH dehydrogenase subunit 3 [Tabachnickia sp. DVL-2014]
MNNLEYTPALITLLLSTLLSSLLWILAFLSSKRKPDPEKISTYECGFDPFESARLPFSVKFFLVGILFMLFDIEISFIFPWCLSIKNNSLNSIINMLLFLLILTLGFTYEWVSGGLNWE